MKVVRDGCLVVVGTETLDVSSGEDYLEAMVPRGRRENSHGCIVCGVAHQMRICAGSVDAMFAPLYLKGELVSQIGGSSKRLSRRGPLAK